MKKNKIKLSKLIGFFTLLLFANISSAQEFLTQLDENTILKEHYLKFKNQKATLPKDTLELPFFDDFSTSNIYPDASLWTDKEVFINNGYSVAPPSLGVATFDALDYKGEFHKAAGYGNVFYADSLTSRPINLNFPGDKTIFLSFFYQPQGRGDNPEVGDSLVLEFYAPEAKTWTKVKKWPGGLLADFKQVMIPILEDQYLKKGFKFRFRNKVTLSNDNQPSKVVNADHWNIDYIYLNKGRRAKDTIYHDMAFVYPMASILKNYESMPWKHFKYDHKSELDNKNKVKAVIHNNDNKSRLIKTIYWVYDDQSGKLDNDTLTVGAQDIPAGNDTIIDPPNIYQFNTNSTDSASFNITAKFITDDYDYKPNNEMVYVQKFYDYYAYDDGSAEVGYGLIGEGTQNAKLAYKFDCKKQDTLKAIQMYFTRSLNDKSQKYFYLTIWDDNAGEPGKIIYQREGIRPEYESGLNKFHTYNIDDTTLVLKGVFYVGWQQTTADLLNIGFDFNRKRNTNIFYNINGTWVNSKFEGALMIRPFFGKSLTTGILVERKKVLAGVNIFPNPTSESITILIEKNEGFKNITVNIYNLSGKLVYQSIQDNNTTINLSDLTEGVYLIRLTDKSGTLNFSSKLIKTR